MNKRSLRILEYNKILSMLTEYATSTMAKKRCDRLKPQRDINTINQLQEETRDALLRLMRQGNVSFTGLTDIGASIKEAIRNLNDKINGHEERISNLEKMLDVKPDEKFHEEPTLHPELPNVLVLTHTPKEKRVVLMVNGIEYDEGDDFTIDREQKHLLWNSGKSFDLEQGDELDIEYYI